MKGKYRTETEKLVELMQRAAGDGDQIKMLTAADEVLRREPANVDAMYVAGTALIQSSQEGLGALVLNAARCATKDPVKLGAIWNNLGWALEKYQPVEAYRCFIESLKFGDAPAGTYDNLCATASTIGRHAEALSWADKAVGFPTHHNRAFALLALGRWEEAWAHYKQSAGTSARPRTERNYDLPRWDGKKKGKVIIHGEQGVGDEIMFMSMLPSDWEGVIECSPRMEGLLQRAFPKTRVYGTLLQNVIEWPLEERADYHIEMGGLGEHYATQPFARGGFLAADAARCAGWRAWLGECLRQPAGAVAVLRQLAQDLGGSERCGGRGVAIGEAHSAAAHGATLVGIAWTGGTWSTGRAERTIPFELIEQLLDAHPNATFVSLEYEDRTEELKHWPRVLNPHWATKKGADLDDLAALVANLDLVISATNSTVDLAGALGVPCWALVPERPPWRYSDIAGEDGMWFYDSVRCYRQAIEDDGSWQRVINRVSKDLRALVKPEAVAAE